MTRKAIIVDLMDGDAHSDNYKAGQKVFVKFSHKSLSPSDGDLWHVSHDGVKWLATMYGRRLKFIAAGDKPQVLPASSVPPVTVKREVLTINKIGVGQTFIVHGKPDEVYVKISNSHVFNHKRLQMHTTDAQRFQSHLNLVVVELGVYNGK